MFYITVVANEEKLYGDSEDVYILARGANVHEAVESAMEELNSAFDVYRYEVSHEDVGKALEFVAQAGDLRSVNEFFGRNPCCAWIDEFEYRDLEFAIEELEAEKEIDR